MYTGGSIARRGRSRPAEIHGITPLRGSGSKFWETSSRRSGLLQTPPCVRFEIMPRLARSSATNERPGVAPDFQLRQLITSGVIASPQPIEPDQVQPNSIDLRLGSVAYRTRCSFLPVGQSI